MIDFDSSSALDELELGAFAAPTGFARYAKQSTSASNDHQRKKKNRELSLKGTSPWFVELVLISELTLTVLRLG